MRDTVNPAGTATAAEVSAAAAFAATACTGLQHRDNWRLDRASTAHNKNPSLTLRAVRNTTPTDCAQ